MNKTYALLASLAVLSLSAPAFAADTNTFKSETKIKEDSKGNYDEKDKTVQSDGSDKTIDKKKVDVDVDSNGNVDKTVKTKHEHKRGWFHKDTVKTKDTEKTKDGQVTTSHEKDVNGKTVEKTTNTSPQE